MDLSKYASCLEMLYTDEIYLLEPITGTDETYGSIVKTWNQTGPIRCSSQDYNGDLAFNEYGMKIECQKRIFMAPTVAISAGWGIAFAPGATEPDLYVKWAPQNKTHRLILAGTR